MFRRCGDYVAKILHGAQPSDLPIQWLEKFDLVINLKTAKALGISVLPVLLATADEVVERNWPLLRFGTIRPISARIDPSTHRLESSCRATLVLDPPNRRPVDAIRQRDICQRLPGIDEHSAETPSTI
jgi:ABC transporter substrate binding protein